MSLAPLKDYLNSEFNEVVTQSAYNTDPACVDVIRVLTIDGRTYQGTLLAIDNSTNLVLTNAEERIIQPADSESPNEVQDSGVVLLRGDLVLVCGLVDEEVDAEIDWLKVRGGPIGTTKHT